MNLNQLSSGSVSIIHTTAALQVVRVGRRKQQQNSQLSLFFSIVTQFK